MQTEILGGAVLDLHKRESAEQAAERLHTTLTALHGTAARVKDERDAAIALLRRALEVREAFSGDSFKSDVRAFLLSLGAPLVMSRTTRQQALEEGIRRLAPDPDEAEDLMLVLQGSLQDRFGRAELSDVNRALDEGREALLEFANTQEDVTIPDEMDLSREDRQRRDEEAEERS
jgi:hypothetical protein